MLYRSESNTETNIAACRNLSRPITRWPGANLFRNPFGELTRAERARLAIVNIRPIIDALCADVVPVNRGSGSVAPDESESDTPGHAKLLQRRAFQLIGECGRGKTTHLLRIRQTFDQSSYVYLADNAPCPPIPEGKPLLIDEAQRLPRGVRRMVFRSGHPLVLATHSDLSHELKRSGYQVETLRIGLAITADRLAAILNARIEASRRDPSLPVPLIGVNVAEMMIRRYGTDVRAIENALYEVVQSQVNHHGEMRFVD